VITALVVWAAVCVPRAGATEAAQPLLGDESDGSRACPIHLIPLFAENDTGEKGGQVDPNDRQAMPFSTRWTCGECHSYGTISRGWHFNATDANVPAGRPGEPWLYFDSGLGLQIPLSYRAWSGTFRPEKMGWSMLEFTRIFGRQMPGGGPGEVTATEPEDIAKQYMSGKLEVNCLACHNAHPAQDQGSPTGYAVQVSRMNFRWAAAASSELAEVTGSAADMPVTYDPFMAEDEDPKAPHVTYNKNAFDAKGNVFMQIVREAPNQRCYFCHSDLTCANDGKRPEKWSQDEDVHVAAGLKCVDCHRAGLQHNIVRGYEGEAAVSSNEMAAATSCRGCHLGDENGNRPEGGRLGAPVPVHKGIPTVHFEKLTCTACHSGPWPGEKTILAKTSRAHRLGTPNVGKDARVLPHVVTPVFARQAVVDANETPKIGPHNLVWPAYWGTLTEKNEVEPIALATVSKVVGAVMKDANLPATGDWAEVKEEQVAKALKAFSEAGEPKPVYVTGGMLYQLNEAGTLADPKEHPAGAPYLWPIAHNVRPAAQSLGVGKCTVCHSTNSAFLFGSVDVDSPIAAVASLTKPQYGFAKLDYGRTSWFAWSFVFRPWFKVVSIGASALIGLVLLLYGLRALAAVVRVLSEQE
jgi:hypothetical protein